MSTILLCKWQPRLVQSLVERNVSLYVILDSFDVTFMSPDWGLLDKAAKVYQISDFNSLEQLAEVASDIRGRGIKIDHIVSFTEFSQFGAGYLDILLRDGAANPMRHVASRDKRIMKELVSGAGVPTASFVSLSSHDDGIQEVADRISYPAVVKPATGFGTMSTMRVGSKDDFIGRLADYSTEPQLNSRHLIVEEFIDGRELYVDAFWRDGQPIYCVLSAYYEPRLALSEGYLVDQEQIDGGYVIPEREDPGLHRRVLEAHQRVNDACGVTDGMTHAEFFQRPDGEVVFSEIATRVGGGWIPEMLTHALGRDIWDIIVEETLDLSSRDAYRGPKEFVGGISIKPAQPGRIVSMTDENDVLSLDGLLHWQVIHGVGDVIELRHPSDWCAFAIVGADSRAEFEQCVAELRKCVRVATAPVSETGE